MNSFMKLITVLLPAIGDVIIGELSPAVRTMIVNTIKALDTKAKETTNPFDDFAVAFLKGLFHDETFK